MLARSVHGRPMVSMVTLSESSVVFYQFYHILFDLFFASDVSVYEQMLDFIHDIALKM